jgi:hypothetical protein
MIGSVIGLTGTFPAPRAGTESRGRIDHPEHRQHHIGLTTRRSARIGTLPTVILSWRIACLLP